ncbi:UDP-N-acetylmuramate dehydrogenase [Brevibacterium jeotgali]|uniref:UDP-N-acetylenolpyruvoylglucosamine reductase n=1 Tax=Brevibacterium jeotgali TaxID=1262550 RepID=A0A2H1L0X3_9MICO|nr:UDP-N-acetylmuramate dehydrogenase [Brevibacterium jeotgali]TWC02151.1 UDP-N-acetylmuramate dehydrogenase [Brevibacterium jeotgali]SMY10499.1 UDP-N-acetylmuramate dehydrogenase [Brevibacterium jeotgali]
MRLSDLTTLRVGGPVTDLREVRSRADLADFVRAHPLTAGAADSPDVLFVAGGSNLLSADEGFAGPVCLIRTRGIGWGGPDADGRIRVTAEAGEDWDAFVAATVARGLSGLEALSGIPGSVGATPVQNVGAYGADVADCLVEVHVIDRVTGEETVLGPEDMGFGYRTSLLKRSAGELGAVRYVVLAVTFALVAADDAAVPTAPVRYTQLARALDVDLGDRVPVDEVRTAVLDLRASKGMVLDASDHDTWSAGSFFTNPILSLVDGPAGRVEARDVLPAGAPAYPVTDPDTGQADPDVVKTSAAWLIEHAGFGRGFTVGEGRAALSTKHTLALTNRGEATAEDVAALARHIRAGVAEQFGITLVPEPNLVGVIL